jgi:hypothetical protein
MKVVARVDGESHGWHDAVIAALRRAPDVELVESGADVIVDLTPSGAASRDAATVLRPEPARLDDRALRSVLLAQAPTLRVAIVARRGASSWTAAESTVKLARFSARTSSRLVGNRVAELVVRAVRSSGREPTHEPSPSLVTAAARPTAASAARFALAGAASLVRSRTTTLEWRAAVGEADPADPFRLPASLRTLHPPRGHFYADPFLAEAGGHIFVFVEDFDLRAGHASISALDVETGAAVPVLDTGSHLSYPFVLLHDGGWFLVPESAAARDVVLYRCESFPGRWVEDTVLFTDVEAYDTTLLRHEGLWWLFFASGTPGSGTDDELHVWFSPALRGPYEPHRRNPVTSTVRGARPAGPIVEHGGRLFRPGQDGGREYGSGIVVHEIERLTTTEYRETVVRTLDGSLVGARGLHTISHAGGLVAIDSKHRPLRWPRRA